MRLFPPEDVEWPLTHRHYFALGVPLTPETYFALQGREQQYLPMLVQWCAEHAILDESTRVHGLILVGPQGVLQYAGLLMCEGAPKDDAALFGGPVLPVHF